MDTNPMRFEHKLKEDGYHLEVDLRRDDCQPGHPPHWHLVHRGKRIASIKTANPYDWQATDKISKALEREVIELTKDNRYKIEEAYAHNYLYGARW